MSARLLTRLRHVDLAVPAYDKQLDFYAGVWGLTKVAEDSGISFLAAEDSPEQYVIRLRKAEEKRLDLVSSGAASTTDVDTLAEQLLATGVQLISQPGKVDTPACLTLVETAPGVTPEQVAERTDVPLLGGVRR